MLKRMQAEGKSGEHHHIDGKGDAHHHHGYRKSSKSSSGSEAANMSSSYEDSDISGAESQQYDSDKSLGDYEERKDGKTQKGGKGTKGGPSAYMNNRENVQPKKKQEGVAKPTAGTGE